MTRLRAIAGAACVAALGCGGGTGPSSASATALRVESVEPSAHSMTLATDGRIGVRFDRPVRAASLTPRSFWAFARWSGPVDAELRLSEDGRAAQLVPRRRLSAGEQVTVFLSSEIQAADGEPLRPGGYSFQFWTRAGPAPMAFESFQVLSTRSQPSEPSRAYGALASDLNRDGALDLTVINEDSADVRVFLNRADGSGQFHPFLRPTAPVGRRASPNEPADFDRDGKVDVCVANIDADTVSILLGDGDGRFSRAQHVPVGRAPRGIAVLDVDGDGDLDIVNTNSGSGTLSLLRNDGAGRFSPPTFFDAGGQSEWALAAADMNDDGLLDLVVGDQAGRSVLVLASNGDGSFTRRSTTDVGGLVWMVATGDVDGDGREDVVAANGRSNNAAVLLGDGAGGLRRSQLLDVTPFVLSSDLGDLDGDGRFEWLLASYNGAVTLLRNGPGGFRVEQVFPARTAGSCTVVFDADGDGDLDLALVDEEADEVRLLRNGRAAGT
jgi:VCBS repeat protein/Big-like domain-containing protein